MPRSERCCLPATAINVLINQGNGTFAPKVAYATGNIPTSLTAADLDGDGMPDLAATNFGNDAVSVLMNQGNGTFAPTVDYAMSASLRSIAAAGLKRSPLDEHKPRGR